MKNIIPIRLEALKKKTPETDILKDQMVVGD